MRAITAHDQSAGADGLSLTDKPYPHLAENDVVVKVHAAGFTPGELEWPGTWTDRAGRDRTPSVPGHDLSGVVVELGHGATGVSVGQRVFGLSDWTRDGSLAEYIAIEARNLAPLPADVDHVTAAALPVAGLTAYQALFVHAHLTVGQTVLINGVAGGVATMAVQLAREIGAVVIGAGRSRHRETALELGVDRFLDLEADPAEAAASVDVVLDVVGGQVQDRCASLLHPGGTLVSIAEPPRTNPEHGRALFFVVEADRTQLTELAQRARDGRLAPRIGAVRPLAEARQAFTERSTQGRTILQVADDTR